MSDKALKIANGMANKLEQDPKRKQKPLVERMVEDADPEKKKKAADSLKKAFGGY